VLRETTTIDGNEFLMMPEGKNSAQQRSVMQGSELQSKIEPNLPKRRRV
jgi:hypothetical protein